MGMPLPPDLPAEELRHARLRERHDPQWPVGVEHPVEWYDARTGEAIPAPDEEQRAQ